MSQEQWTAVDKYICDLFVPSDPALDAAMADCVAAGLPAISVSPNQGKLLHLLARMNKASAILEIGTLGGYSAIWLARALPADGRLITLEMDETHANIARRNIARAGLAEKVDIRLGKALDTLPRLEAEKCGPFDFVFIDADKSSTPEYFAWAMKLTRPGAVIVTDNVVRSGKIVNADSSDGSIQGIRRFNEMLANDQHVTATEIQTVGSKGYDGFAFAIVN